ncbi:MAG: lytic transglycosylase domain-containing protein [Pseudobdellovibrio sp.]
MSISFPAQAFRKKKKVQPVKIIEIKNADKPEVAEKIDLSDIKILNEFFELKKTNPVLALDKIEIWQPKRLEDTYYKDFFKAEVQKTSEVFWKLYKDLKKNKKLLRIQLEALTSILDIDLANGDKKFSLSFVDFKKEAKLMIRKVSSLPEGLDFELKYLKWVRKYEITEELCKTERKRWLAQTSLDFADISKTLSTCPVKYDEFIYRLRMLIFSGEEKKAQAELNEFKTSKDLLDWQKAYLQAILYTNMGDPILAYNEVKNYEKEILETDDYYNNLFYITQRAGELGKAEILINKIYDKATTGKEKKEALYQKAFLFYQTKKYKEAVALLDNLIKTNSSFKAKHKKLDYDDLTWLKAWCQYLDKNFEQAILSLQENKQWTRDKARNLYWTAQTEWALDRKATALDHFKQLALPLQKGDFFNYYNFLAWLRFESYKSFVTNDLLRSQLALIKSGRGPYLIPDDQVDPMRIVNDYRTYFEDMSVTDEGDIQVVNRDSAVADQSDIDGIAVSGSADIKRQLKWADALISWGYADFAKWHLFEVEKSLKTRNAADILVQYYIEKNFYNRGLSLLQKLTSPQEKKISLRDDELLWKSLYPRAYHLNTNSEALIRKINPNLIWSIMKAETQYKYDAISPVGAIGLMQFMPYTSQKVALLLKDKHDVKDLFKPDVAIQYGAAYLKKLSVEFDSQLPLVAAAYNGGPHRVKLWLRNLGDIDFDVFIEHIPFPETRTYVKRVLSFYVTYQKIYDEKIDIKKMNFLIEKNPYKIKEPISLKEEWDISIK